MIFGENFGQLAASGEYELYKSGTTLAQLNEAIAGLSIEEYLDSFITVVYPEVSGETRAQILYPWSSANKIYLKNFVHPSGANEISTTSYWYNNNVYWTRKYFSNGSVSSETKSTGGGNLTVSEWTLYRRQKSYDISMGGSNVAQAIAPVQETLSAANRNYAVGDQFLYDGHLYKVISAITSGAQIVLGTNAVLADDIVTQIKPTDVIANEDMSPITSNAIFRNFGGNKIKYVQVTQSNSISIAYSTYAFFCYGRATTVFCGFAEYNLNVNEIKKTGTALSATAYSTGSGRAIQLKSSDGNTAYSGFVIFD